MLELRTSGVDPSPMLSSGGYTGRSAINHDSATGHVRLELLRAIRVLLHRTALRDEYCNAGTDRNEPNKK